MSIALCEVPLRVPGEPTLVHVTTSDIRNNQRRFTEDGIQEVGECHTR
jgi:hypothetical protein